MDNILKSLLQEYQPNDIYNADETSFFYKMLANRTYAFEDETVQDSKHLNSKNRLSVL